MEKVSSFFQNRRDFIKISIKSMLSAIYLSACGMENADQSGTESVQDQQHAMTLNHADLLPLLENNFPRSMIAPLMLSQLALELDLSLISGSYPQDIEGIIYFIHPMRTQEGECLLLGDGIVNALSFESTGVKLKRRLLKPPCYYLEQLCIGTEEAFQIKDLLKTSNIYGKREILNTNLFIFKDYLLCTNDAGRPYLLDGQSLTLTSAIAPYRAWKTSLNDEHIGLFNAQPLKGYMTSAHPAYDQSECFFVNWGMNLPQMGVLGFLDLIRWQGEQRYHRYTLMERDSDGELKHVCIEMSVHQIALTEKYILILDTAFRAELEDIIGLGENVVKPQLDSSLLYLVPRSALEDQIGEEAMVVEVKKLRIPRESAHFIADFKHLDNGNLIIYLAHQCANDPSEFISEGDIHPITQQPHPQALHGMLTSTTDIGVFGKYEIDVSSNQVVQESLLISPLLYGGPSLYAKPEQVQDRLKELWLLSFGLWDELRCQRIEKAYEDYAYRQIPIQELSSQPAQLVKVALDHFQIADAFAFPAGRFPSTPTFVPKKNALTPYDGYLVVIVFTDDQTQYHGSSGHEIWGFDAQSLKAGPLFRLSAPSLQFNFSLHSQYSPQAVNGLHEMNIDLWSDYEDRLSKLSAAQKERFQEAIRQFYTQV